MRSFGFAFTLLALSGSVLSAPLAPQLRLIDSAKSAQIQQQILHLEQTLVSLSTTIARGDDLSILVNFDSSNTEFALLAKEVLSPEVSCLSAPQIDAKIDSTQALFALSTTQNHLADLIIHLQDASLPESILAADFCSAQARFQIVHSAQSEFSPTTSSTGQPNRLSGTYITSRIALDALISALNAAPYSPASAQEAYDTAHVALAAYKLAANPMSGVQCQPGAPAPPRSPADAINRVSIVEKAAETAFADTRENNGKSFYDFCNVENYMGSVRGFVHAWWIEKDEV